jgi:hypothetical protein
MAVPCGYLSLSQMNVAKQAKNKIYLSSKFDSTINSGQDYKDSTYWGEKKKNSESKEEAFR